MTNKLTALSGSYFKLLTPGNPKIAKGIKKGFMTFILHLAPAKLSGYEVCPMRSKGCTMACLNTAGRGGMLGGHKGALTHDDVANGTRNTIQEARIRRTKLFFEARETFMMQLVADIAKAIKWCAEHDLEPVFRLNGTSDIRWETVPCAVKMNGEWHAFANVFAAFPHVQFYDYTKIANRKNVPSNYDLTFSRTDGNEHVVGDMLAQGYRVAAVFRDIPTLNEYKARDIAFIMSNKRVFQAAVIDGDDSDLRFLEPRGVVVGLYAKGQAKRDTSGFVID
jgi:hypothetical protein